MIECANLQEFYRIYARIAKIYPDLHWVGIENDVFYVIWDKKIWERIKSKLK